MKRIGTLIFLLILSSTIRMVAKPQFFTTDHDLTSSLINVIYQDRNGMIWVGTEDGLNRYDGSKFTQYRNIPGDSTSLSQNYVNMVFEDSKGRLFVCTHHGLQMHNPVTDKFTPVARTVDGNVYPWSAASMLETEPDSIWILSSVRAKVVKADYDGVVVKRWEDSSSPIFNIGDGVCDVAGFQWLFDRNGLYRLNRKHEIVAEHKEINDPVNLEAAVARDGTLYVAAFTGGLYRYDMLGDKFIKINDPGGKSLLVKDIYPDDESNDIYLATDGRGLKKYSPETGEFSDVMFGEGILDCQNQKVHSVLKDKGGNLWIAIFQKGIVLMPSHPASFKYVGHKSLTENVIGEECVVALLKEQNSDKLWIGVDNGGLYELDMKTMSTNRYINSVPQVLSGMFMDSKNNLWIGSYTYGCGIFDTEGKKYNKIHLYDENGREVVSVYDFAEDEYGHVWIATLGGGLFMYDPQTRKVQSAGKHTGDKWFTSAYYSVRNKTLYLGTYDGALKIKDINDGGHVEKYVPSNIIHSINESSDGNVWFASSAGLVRLNPDNDSIEVYTDADGLPVNTIYGIEEDDMGILWISTSHGLSQFNRKNGTFTNYFVDDGLQGNEFYKNSSFKDSDGQIYFGGINGITYFNPADVVKPGRKWTVRLADIYLHGKPVKGGMKSGGRTIVNEPPYGASEIKLSDSDNSFSIEFATTEFGNPESMRYQYSMDGDKWVTLAHGSNMVNFSDLNSGKHTLRLRAEDNGVVSDEKLVTIDIAWPWYETWWACVIYCVLIVLALLGIYSSVLLSQRHKRQELEQRQRERINEAKFQFFINISHEIRTPMSLVMGPLQKMMDSDDDPERQKNYRLIRRNANRVLRLVNELMDIRKIDKNRLKLTFAETALTPFIEDLYDTFQQAASTRDIRFTFEHEGCDDLKAWVDVANFDKIVMNLLSNAIKYTPKGGTVEVRLSKGTDMSESGPLRDYAEISVTDTGIGISKDEQKHIFERFYQAGNNTAGGTGVGLHLTKSLVGLHHGTISVMDNPAGTGTRFAVRIPLGCNHLSDERIVQTDVAEENGLDRINALKDSGLALPACCAEDIEPSSDSRQTPKEVVMIVEDDEDIRSYLCRELSANYRTVACENGKAAYEQMLHKIPDLVISDVMMPEMDGLELTRRIKNNINLNHIPVILLSAKNRDEDNIEGLESGADAYMSKPFNIEILISTIANLIKGHQRLKNAFSGQQMQDDKITELQVESYDEKLMEKVMKVINDNISNPDLTVEMLASEVGLSRTHLHRKLKEITNQSSRTFIRNTRLRLSVKMIVDHKLTVSDVAMRLGFKSANNFSTSFKLLYGVTPSEYAERARNEGEKEEL